MSPVASPRSGVGRRRQPSRALLAEMGTLPVTCPVASPTAGQLLIGGNTLANLERLSVRLRRLNAIADRQGQAR